MLEIRPAARQLMQEPDSDDSGETIHSLVRGLEVLRAFNAGNERMTIAEAARATGLTRAGARRVLLTLEKVGYVRSDGRHYYLTARVLEFGQGFLGQPIWQAVRPVLLQVAETLNETVSAGVLDGMEVIYTVRVRSARVLHLELRAGARLPAFASSIGRVLLAALSRGQLERYLKQVTFTRFTKFTVMDADTLRQRLDVVRAQGWCHVRDEMEEGVSGIAVPLADTSGRTVAALSVSTSSDRSSARTVKNTIVPMLQEAARTIRKELQHF